jgi:hypothetical protein
LAEFCINLFSFIFTQLLPKRIDWEGREHERSFESLVRFPRAMVAKMAKFYFLNKVSFID